MGKRVYEVAEELGVEAKQIVLRLKESGVDVKDHLSSLSKEEEDLAKKLFEEAKQAEVELRRVAGGRVVRRRVRAEPVAEPEVVTPPAPDPVAQTPEPAPVVEESSPAPEPVVAAEVPVEVVAETPAAPEPEPAVEAPVIAEEPAVVEEAPVPIEPVEPEEPKSKHKADDDVVPVRSKGKSKEVDARIPDDPADRKRRRLIVDKRRDVFSIRDYIGISEEDPDTIEQPTRQSNRRKGRSAHQQRRGRAQQKPSTVAPKAEKRVVRVEAEAILVSELAHAMGVRANDVIRKLMGMGVMASLTQALDLDTAGILASEFGYVVEKVGFDPTKYLSEPEDGELELLPRPPVITIMGHVDHGKTTLLDRIRNASVADGEAGGITQHIGAYKVNTPGGKIVFLDTPGHEAFTAMRARGASATDIVILVVAADDGVMAQTREAISHAKAADVPIIVAINKIDKPGANLDRIRSELAEEELVSEEWGGNNIFCEISAKMGLGIENLMEAILIQAEMLELKANPNKPGRGIVLEAELDRTLGPVATVLVQSGTLKTGDVIIAGIAHGRARVMTDDQGRAITEAGPSIPVRIAGLGVVPDAGDIFVVMPDERKAKEVAQWQIEQAKRARAASSASRVSLEDFYSMVQTGSVKELRVVVKADVQGSLSPLIDSLTKLRHPEIKLRIIHSAVGNVTESDVSLAMASDAVIVGFNVGVDPKASHLAEMEKVDIKKYSVIYNAIDEVARAMEGLLQPKYVSKIVGRADVRQVFHISKIGKIAGCLVTMGSVTRNVEVRVVRNGETIHTGKVTSLKRVKDDVREVKQGMECGIGIEGFEALAPGDMLEFIDYDEIRETIQTA